MYLSHPVRRIRDDPIDGEEVTLRVTAVDAERADALAERLASVGTVEERLRFGGIRVTVQQERVADVCALSGIEAVETDSTVTIDAGDAGEDVTLDGTE